MSIIQESAEAYQEDLLQLQRRRPQTTISWPNCCNRPGSAGTAPPGTARPPAARPGTRRHGDRDPVGQALRQESRDHLRPAFHHQAVDPFLARHPAGPAETPALHHRQAGPAAAPRRLPAPPALAGRRPRVVAIQAGWVGALQQPSLGWRAQAAVQDHRLGVAASTRRTVSCGSSASTAPTPTRMASCAARSGGSAGRTAAPLSRGGLAALSGQAAIQALGITQADQRPPGSPAVLVSLRAASRYNLLHSHRCFAAVRHDRPRSSRWFMRVTLVNR